MPCVHYEGGIVVCRGPETERAVTKTQRSAAWCERCKRRRVQTLVINWPVMHEGMSEGDLLNAAMWGPSCSWECPCGHQMYARGYGEDW